MATNVVVLLESENGRRLVREKCKAAGLDMEVLKQLIDAELDHSGDRTKRAINTDFDQILAAANTEDS